MSSIFKRAAERGSVQNRTPFLDVKGIFDVEVEAVRSGENGSGLPFVAIDIKINGAKSPDPDFKFVAGETRTLMQSMPKDKKLEDMFHNTLVTWGLAILRAIWVDNGSQGDEPTADAIDADILEKLFGAESVLVGRGFKLESTPRKTKSGATVWNYIFGPASASASK